MTTPLRGAVGGLLAFALLSVGPAVVRAQETSAPLKALFLGDQGHHRPADRAAQILPVLAARGIDVTYTEDTAKALSRDNLAKYDVLIVYANTERITPDQEKALIEYVEGGGGFAPLHCASYCFLNSPAYIALVGAQFQRHGTGTFDTKVVDGDHPITKGLEPFNTWDETYVHTKHNAKDRQVLQVRAEGDREEPWTWTRTQGKGRIFYTAYGHDERTWGHPGFQDLIERGVRWASGKGEVFDSRPRVAKGLKPFKYVETSAGIPNYLPGQRWGTQGEPARTMQEPVDPAESMKHLALPKGFEAKLFAAEPEIAKPICMNWDHRGRLWIGESTDYPNNKLTGRTGADRIKICEDTDGDGKADKFTIFAEGLNIPSSLTFSDGGIVLLQAPDTLFLKDTDGDDKADVRKVLFTGWGTQDTHAGPSNLRWGLDGWIYGIVGYSAFRGTVGGETHRFGQGFYRFKPDGSKLEFLRSTNNNSWGVGFSEEGLLFGSTANGCPSVYLPIPNRYYEGVRGGSARVLQNIADSNRFFPITDKVRQVDWHGGFTAAAGHALYTARAYPPVYWNNTAFVAEPTGHLVATFTLEKRGSDYASHNAWNLLASDDEWTSPIMAEVGPDGQVWIIDWYNYIVQHNPTPQGFRTGRGAAYETPLRDKTHGRIYRVVYKDAKPATLTKLDPSDAPGLVAALKNDNMFWRQHAQRLLIERGKNDVVPDLVRIVNDPSVDAIGLNPGAIHAMWTLRGLNAIDDANPEALTATVSGLKHASAGVRRNALQVLPRREESTQAIVASGVLKDRDAQVRLAALLAMAEMPTSESSAKALVDVLSGGPTERDAWLTDAAVAAAARHDLPFLRTVAQRPFDAVPNDRLLRVVDRVSEHYARGGSSDSVNGLAAVLPDAHPRVAETIVAGLARGWPRDRTAKLDEAGEQALIRLLTKVSADAKGHLVSLGNRWGSERFRKYGAEVSTEFLTTVRDEARPEADRLAAARQLIEFRAGDEEAVREILSLITPRTAPTLSAGLIEAIARSTAPEGGSILTESLGALTPGVRPTALRALLGRSDWTASLLNGVEKGQVRLTELTLDQKQALSAHPERSIAGRARALLARGGGLPDADRQKVIDALGPVVLRGGDTTRGKEVFRQQCAKCHLHSGEGGKVGPDLTGMAAHPAEELLVHILDPSRSVEGNFVQYTVATTDGRILSGLMASETKTTVELLDAEGKTHVLQRADIDELAASKKSIMPEGFEKQVTSEALADLIAFLTARGKYLPLDLRSAATIVSTQGMFTNKDAPVERLVFPDWSPKTFEGVPFQLVDPRGDRVPNVVLLRGPQGSIPATMPRSVEVPCHVPARTIHILGGVGGWAYPYGEQGSVSLIVRLHYKDGKTEDHPLRNGVELADYIRPVDVPGSKLAFRLGGRQVRYLALHPKRPTEPIERIELVKGDDDTAPVVMALTVEGGDAPEPPH